MFTGLIEEVGSVVHRRPRGSGLSLRIAARRVLEDLVEGDSIAVNGVCLTAAAIDGESFRADLLGETVRRTSFGRMRPGTPVNLERPLRVTDRMGGHIVQGHVDGIAEIVRIRPSGEDTVLTVRCPDMLSKYFVEKGSVALDGVSLTIASVAGAALDVALIPETLRRTAFRSKRPGDAVHVEVDVIGKYVEKLLCSSSMRRGKR